MSGLNGSVDRLTRPALTASYQPQFWGRRFYNTIDGHPAFTWLEAERMRFDPQIQFGLRILRSPLYGATWKVRADDAAVERWVDRELSHVYRRMMPKIVRHFEYGVSGGEITLKQRKVNGRTRIHFKDFLEIHPNDMRPHVWEKGPKAGKIACIEVSNARNGKNGSVFLDNTHGFWFCGDNQFGQFYGRARLQGAHLPWFDKAARHAVNDMIRLYYRKQSFIGPKLFYPPGVTDMGSAETGTSYKNNQDIAREICEKFESGGVLALPSTVDENDNFTWRWEDPKAFADATGLLDLKKALDRDILVGLGIPPELVEAATVGSGYSGRAIPAQVFFSSMDEEIVRIIEAIDRQIIRKLVKLNFGKVPYAIEPVSMAKQVASDPAHAGTPAGAGSQPQEAAGGMMYQGPRGGHGRINPSTGKPIYENKRRVRLSMTADHSVSAAAARSLWDEADSPIEVSLHSVDQK